MIKRSHPVSIYYVTINYIEEKTYTIPAETKEEAVRIALATSRPPSPYSYIESIGTSKIA